MQAQSLGRKTPRRRKWQLTPVLLPGESHGRRNLVGCSPRGCTGLDMTEQLSTPPEEGQGAAQSPYPPGPRLHPTQEMAGGTEQSVSVGMVLGGSLHAGRGLRPPSESGRAPRDQGVGAAQVSTSRHTGSGAACLYWELHRRARTQGGAGCNHGGDLQDRMPRGGANTRGHPGVTLSSL